MTLNKFASGTAAVSAEVNANESFAIKQALIARLAAIDNGTQTDYYGETKGLLYTILPDQSTAAHVDTTNSTCLYSERGLVAFCDVLDLHDDASIDTNIWTSATSGSGSTSEASGYLEVEANSTGTTDSASIITSGASGLNINGQNTEVILDFSASDTTSGGGHGGGESHSIKLQISDGSTHVDVKTVTQGNVSGTTTFNGYIRIVYDHSNNRFDVWETPLSTGIETLTQNNVSVAALTSSRYIRILVTSVLGSASATSSYGRIYAIGYRKNGAGAANADFVNASKTMSKTSTSALHVPIWLTTPATTPTVVFSASGNTTYSTDDIHEAKGEIGTTGTSYKARLRVAKPTTITADTQNIPVLYAWVAAYD